MWIVGSGIEVDGERRNRRLIDWRVMGREER